MKVSVCHTSPWYLEKENERDAEMTSSSLEIKYIACPKCKTPIKRSFRYGNIIKEIKANIEDVKATIRKGSSCDFDDDNSLWLDTSKFELETAVSKVLTKLEWKDDKFSLWNCRNSHLENLSKMLNQCSDHAYEHYMTLSRMSNASELAYRQLQAIVNWIMQKRVLFSQQ